MKETADALKSGDSKPRCIEEIGPWPFITKRIFEASDKKRTLWSSRHHRKHLQVSIDNQTIVAPFRALSLLWMPWKMNWWIGIGFTIGSFLFALASVLSLLVISIHIFNFAPRNIMLMFFTGSLFFTGAAYLQLFQAANAVDILHVDPPSEQRRRFFGWRPKDIGWLSSMLQFAGTLWFNINTFDAMFPSLNWLQQDVLIWLPNFIGSILFLLSGHAAFAETCHKRWGLEPHNLSWWVVFFNLIGCFAFLVASLFAIVLPFPMDAWVANLSMVFTLLGALGFLAGSLLLLPEATSPSPD
ncbi:MAG: hypothetical protein MK106_02400 [Mariniblastus sp.]|nr:hypothetical protein [Mariniblastus sp.]